MLSSSIFVNSAVLILPESVIAQFVCVPSASYARMIYAFSSSSQGFIVSIITFGLSATASVINSNSPFDTICGTFKR